MPQRRIRHAAVLALLASAALLPPRSAAARSRSRGPVAAVALDGATWAVRWIDGDTFRFLDGPYQGSRARLEGFNTLERYGPVHRWGAWRAEELQALADEATSRAAERRWRCTTRGRQDRYRRILVACPDLATALVRSGHAMVFAIGLRPDPALLSLQHEAQRRGDGMWAKGVPAQLVSSVHSRDEGPRAAYDRLVDTRTGRARPRPHARSYRTCEEVCAGDGADRSCMVYVPLERRYRGRPACLARSEPSREDEAVRERSQRR